MNFIKKYKSATISLLIILLILVFSFFVTGVNNSSYENNEKTEQVINTFEEVQLSQNNLDNSEENSTDISQTPLSEQTDKMADSNKNANENPNTLTKNPSNDTKKIPDESTTPEIKQSSNNPSLDTLNSASVPVTEADAATETSVEESEEKTTCTLLVRCDTILNNIEKLDSAKKDIVPQNGVIFYKENISFSDGESVFDVILREFKNNGIHFEFVKTPGINSVYIEGIANLYEFDCGDLSGWIYRVNGKIPSYDTTNCILKDNDKIELLYTCNLGLDL